MSDDIYYLEIYSDGATNSVVVSFHSKDPFLSINMGDLLNPYTWGIGVGDNMLLVTRVEHIIWDTENRTKHKICVYTKSVENTKEIRY